MNQQFVYIIANTSAKNTYFYEHATLVHVRPRQIRIYSNQSWNSLFTGLSQKGG